jgi:hypothetical protein
MNRFNNKKLEGGVPHATWADLRHFTITTTNGTRWAATGTSLANVAENFFGHALGLEIESITLDRLFTHEEEEELRKEKIEMMSW